MTQARAELAELINRVVYGGEQVVVTRHGKLLVALVSAADLQRLEEPEVSADEQMISTVSTLRPGTSAAAEHRGAEGTGRRPGTAGH